MTPFDGFLGTGGAMVALKNAVIHSLEKEAHETATNVRHGKGLLNPADEMVLRLATKLAELVGKEGNAVLWGQFAAANREGEFPGAVRASMKAKLDDDSFLALSRAAMKELSEQAEKKTGATGGHIFFGQFSSNGSDFLLVAMMKKKGAIQLSDDLQPTHIDQIDMSKLHQAARINLTNYEKHLARDAANEEAPDAENLSAAEKTYLCFVNRRGREEVADYFIDALGCVKGTSSSQLTTKLLKYVKEFVRDNNHLREMHAEIKQGVVDYLQSLTEEKPVVLDEVVQAAKAKVKPQEALHLDTLKEFLNSERCQIPDEFTLSREVLKAHIRIRAKSSNWSFWFETGSVGTKNTEIIYDPETKGVTFTKLPLSTIEGVEDALRARGELP
ncbi:nucleoid-associated protein [Xanthomonas albilineans]|uniref:nucleoid-associated protein n=1 Tax=Xanthomonas albilineans TaxID=29447 RepID=UPI001E37E2F8|nr:nucleoid-associated protein [Xanthomonas albilineans]